MQSQEQKKSKKHKLQNEESKTNQLVPTAEEIKTQMKIEKKAARKAEKKVIKRADKDARRKNSTPKSEKSCDEVILDISEASLLLDNSIAESIAPPSANNARKTTAWSEIPKKNEKEMECESLCTR